MLTETRQISNLRSQDVSKEILSDLVRKNVAEFSDKFFHFQYATLEMFKAALNNYSMLKLCFLINSHTFTCIVKTSPISIMQLIRTPNHIFYRRIAPKQVRSMSIFFYLPQILSLCSLFPLKGKLKYIIIHFPYEISNDIIQCFQFSCQLLPLIVPSVD